MMRPGKRADVGAPMAANLRFIAHAAERDAHEITAEGAGDGPAQRSFTDARRADEAKYRTFDLAA